MTQNFKVRIPHTTHDSTYTLPAGLINDRVRFAYTHGQCHALAQALCEILGMPPALIVSSRIEETLNMSAEEILASGEVPDYAAAWHWDHALVQLGPDFLDIRGVLTKEQASVSQKGYLIVPSTLRQLKFLIKETNPARANMDAARHYAKLVIKEYLGAPRLSLTN